ELQHVSSFGQSCPLHLRALTSGMCSADVPCQLQVLVGDGVVALSHECYRTGLVKMRCLGHMRVSSHTPNRLQRSSWHAVWLVRVNSVLTRSRYDGSGRLAGRHRAP